MAYRKSEKYRQQLANMRAAKAGGMIRVGQVAKILIFSVTAARPAISVKLSSP